MEDYDDLKYESKVEERDINCYINQKHCPFNTHKCVKIRCEIYRNNEISKVFEAPACKL